jgi:cyclic pyranopterin phosphate synthase
VLRYEEILRLIRIGVCLGISKVRITGGEPLIRKGVYDFLAELAQIEGLVDISLTTNGVLLRDHIEEIKSAGIKRINVSLDTLSRKKYEQITGHDSFEQVWKGILAAHDMGFDPIKINVVALNGLNDDDLADLAGLTFSYPFHIRFIEYMPMGTACLMADRHLPTPEIKTRIHCLGNLVPVKKGAFDGPADRYRFEGARGEIGFISAISQHFCHRCNRLRLTASGHLRPCLLSDFQIDLKGPLRKGCLDKELVELFLKTAHCKPYQHGVAMEHPAGVSGQMHAIGG